MKLSSPQNLKNPRVHFRCAAKMFKKMVGRDKKISRSLEGDNYSQGMTLAEQLKMQMKKSGTLGAKDPGLSQYYESLKSTENIESPKEQVIEALPVCEKK